ncbi:MAG: hypothetical protein ACON5B_17310 [Myxococcota bacterium]
MTLLLTLALVACGPSTTPDAPPPAAETPEPASPPSATPPAPSEPDPANATEAPTPATPTPCNLDAFVTDGDPKGLNVRDAPTTKGSTVLGQLPTTIDVMLHVVASQDGWFKFDQAEDIMGERAMPQAGWVSGTLLGTGVKNYGSLRTFHLYSAASSTSPVVGTPGEETVSLLACEGAWVKVKSGAGTGWLAPEAQCPNPVTTCP